MRFVVLVIIIILAVGAGLGMLWLSGGKQGPAASGNQDGAGATQVATVDVLVAREDIPLGTPLVPEMVDRQPWPRHLVLEGFVTSEMKDVDVTGMVARSDFKAREPLTLSKLSKPGDVSFLAGSLPKGMRAVTVGIDPVSGVAGFLFPGDRVDVIFTHSVPQQAPTQLWGIEKKAGTKPTTSEVLLPNLKVLAVNTRKGRTSQDRGSKGVEVVETPSNVTLEMTQEEAQKLRLAEKNGTLSLALRATQDKDDIRSGQPIDMLELTAMRPDEVILVRGIAAQHVGREAPAADMNDDRPVVVAPAVPGASTEAQGALPEAAQ